MLPNVCRPVDRRTVLSILLGLSLLTMMVRALQIQAAASPEDHSGRRGPDAEQPRIRYVTTAISLATGVSPKTRALAIDESLGLAYLADGERGTVTVVAGTTLVNVIPVGQEVTDIAVDAGTGFVYASVPDPYALFDGHIAVIRGGEVITRVAVSGYPGPLTVDSQHSRAYVGVRTRELISDQIIVLQRSEPIAIVSVPPHIVALDVDPKRDHAYAISSSHPALSIISGMANAAVIPLDDMGTLRDVAVDPASGLAYVVGQSASRDDIGTVVVISGTEQIARLSVGSDPRHMAVDPQRERIYVSNTGDDTVTIIDGIEVVDTVDVGPKPGAIAVDPAHNRVYVSNTGDSTTTVLSGQETVTALPAGGGPLAVDTERGVAYLSGEGLAVAQDDSLLGHLPTAAMPAHLAINPESGLVYVGDQGTDTLDVLSETGILATLHLSDTPQAVVADPVSGRGYVALDTALTVMRGAEIEATLPITARDIALDPVRGLVYAASDGVAVIRDRQVLDTVNIGQAPHGVAVNRATGLAYATAGGQEDGFVAVINGTEHIDTISTGGAPGKPIVDPVRDRVFVLHPGQGRLSVIQGTRRRFPSILLPRPALDAAVDPVRGNVYIATRGSLIVISGLDEDPMDLEIKALAVAVDVERGLTYATTRGGQVAVLNGTDVLATLPAGHRPVDLAIDSETGRVYVANFGSDTITMIEREQPASVYLPYIHN